MFACNTLQLQQKGLTADAGQPFLLINDPH